MSTVTLEGLTKIYANGVVAVQDLSLHVDDGEFVVIVGPSGCGKTTALRMVAGLEEITSGTLRFGDRVVNDVLAARARRGHGVPELRPVPAPERAPEHRLLARRTGRYPRPSGTRRCARRPPCSG